MKHNPQIKIRKQINITKNKNKHIQFCSTLDSELEKVNLKNDIHELYTKVSDIIYSTTKTLLHEKIKKKKNTTNKIIKLQNENKCLRTLSF